MKPIFLDMVWPAIFVSTTFYKFWYLVIGTIIIETFVIKLFLKFNWKMSIIASLVGNCISGFIGTFIMIWAMLFWHFVADNFVPNGTFGTTNWVATFVLMCLGSVFLETLAIKILYKEKIKKLFLPMLTGNFLSYLFIAYSMITNSNANPAEKSIQTIKYLPNKQNFILLNKSKLFIDTSIIKISIDKNGKRMNDSKSPGYYLTILFKKENKNDFQFEFKILEDQFTNGITDSSQELHLNELKNEFKVLMEQKNTDTSLGWQKPIITDTLIFKRIKK